MVVSRWKLSITALNLNSDVYCLRLLVIGSYLLSLLTVYFIRYVTPLGEVRKNGQQIPEGECTWIAFPFHLIGINAGEAFELEIVNASGVGIGQADFLQAAFSQARENKRCRTKILRMVSAHSSSFAFSGSGIRHSCGFPFHLPSASRELLRIRIEVEALQILPYFGMAA